MISIILPVFNQDKIIETAVNRINALPVEKEIIVVNDCSLDNTAAVLRGIVLNNLKVIHHVSCRGKAAAIRTGMENASGELVILQNGNLNCNPSDYLKLLEAFNNSGADMVLGARFSKMSQGILVPKTKSYFLTYFLNFLFGVRLHDWFTHCQLIRRESFLGIVSGLKSADTLFEILTKAIQKKMRIIEVPISYGQENTCHS
ncbi:MAG: glycosyltransferase family 2 protein [Candidatus Omnitrophica bacterium]|nr:glycosyltransferase family 2 protein [Candidatus Omnitrophota bacterium]